MNVVIRRTLPDDLTVIEAIYRDSIRHLGPSVYSPAQVAAWAHFADDAVAFCAWIATATTFVAVGPSRFSWMARSHRASRLQMASY